MVKTMLWDWAVRVSQWCLPKLGCSTGPKERSAFHLNNFGSQKLKKSLAKRTKGEYTVFVNQSSCIFPQKWPKFGFRVRIRITVPYSVLAALRCISSLKMQAEEQVHIPSKSALAREEQPGCGFKHAVEQHLETQFAPRFIQTALWPEFATEPTVTTKPQATATLRKPNLRKINLNDFSFVQDESLSQNLWRRLRHRIGTCDSTCQRCKHKWAVIELTPRTGGKRVRAFRAYA